MTKEEYIEKINKIEDLKRQIQTIELETNSFEENAENKLVEECSKFVGEIVRQDMGTNCARFMLVTSLRGGCNDAMKSKCVTEVILGGPGVTINVEHGEKSAHIDSDCEIYVWDSVEKSGVTFLTVDEKERAEEFIKNLLKKVWGNDQQRDEKK